MSKRSPDLVFPKGSLTTAEAAEFLKSTAESLTVQRCRGSGPPWHALLGKHIYYLPDDLKRYQQQKSDAPRVRARLVAERRAAKAKSEFERLTREAEKLR
jgi:hypothetical protein